MSEEIGWLETVPQWVNRMRPQTLDDAKKAIQYNNNRLVFLGVVGMVASFLLGRTS